MKLLFQRLFKPRPQPAERAPERALPAAPTILAPDWLPGHQGSWNLFLRSPAGVVLMARLKAVAHQVSVVACKDSFHTSHSAGTANGWNEAVQWLESLSRSSRVIEDSTAEAVPQPGTESQNDTPAPGEELLRERLSP